MRRAQLTYLIIMSESNTPKTSTAPKADLFADIATSLPIANRPGLELPERTAVSGRSLPLAPLAPNQAQRPLATKIKTVEDLDQALAAERERTKSYLADHAPALPVTRVCVPFNECQWRIETDADRSALETAINGAGDWETVSIPHYGPPLGKASTLYRVTFDLPEAVMEQESIVLCFDAVDYRCLPYLNGFCLGSHEGIFEGFEFNIKGIARAAGNTLLIRVENDFTMLGEAFAEGEVDGDKVYAATGLGYDDPELGWHHCPAGMGIWQPFRIEGRSRLSIVDLYVRPLPSMDAVEILVEVENAGTSHSEAVALQVSIYGQNFEAAVHVDHLYRPTTSPEGGFGDLDKEMPDSAPLLLGGGRNFLKVTLPMSDPRIWDLDTPWLYQAQVRLVDEAGALLDVARQQFGMRHFTQDEHSEPKGKFYLNDREIRLRGANTMGNLDMCVFREDWDQLVDDILLARLTNMNFLRLTQHPVQKAVYEYCDRLGMMLQTDLPLFASIRQNQFLECVRQAGAMEKLVRSHPSNILVSFINEPFPNGRGRPHRFLSRAEMELFFDIAIKVVHRENPDRVIKCVDGDYDPPAEFGMPDNHCYCGWYLGHGIDLGQLHAGHWLPVKAGWHYGCGEFGAEGLDSLAVMQQFYPQAWQASSPESAWNPGVINQAQTMNFHGLWYSTPGNQREWIEASQAHQEWTNRLMTEAFRRMAGMNTFAIHLFIDAWPAGWMKTIMDVNRTPKKSWFSYRDALEPLAVSLRSDRVAGFSAETLLVEAWVVNDYDEVPAGCLLDYEVIHAEQVIARGSLPAEIARCAPHSQGVIPVKLPAVVGAGQVEVGLSLVDAAGHALHDTQLSLEVYPPVQSLDSVEPGAAVHVLGDAEAGQALLQDLGIAAPSRSSIEAASVLLITDMDAYLAEADRVDSAVRAGAIACFLPLPVGSHQIGTSTVKVAKAGMGPRHFVSCATGHQLVAGFSPDAFKFWYHEACGHVSPILNTTLDAEQWDRVLESGDGGWQRPWGPVTVAAEHRDGKGCWRICQVSLVNRLKTNPAAHLFAQRFFQPVHSAVEA